MQLLLPLTYTPLFLDSNFAVSESNIDAASWVFGWPNWGHERGVVLYGDKGCGKTHLVNIWQKISDAVLVDLFQLDFDDVPRLQNKNIVIEDVDRVLDGADKYDKALIILFYILNLPKINSGSLLLTSSTVPSRWNENFLDIRSRATQLVNVRINLPTIHLLMSVIDKMMRDRHINISKPIIQYLVYRIPSTFDAAIKLVNILGKESWQSKQGISFTLAKKALDMITHM